MLLNRKAGLVVITYNGNRKQNGETNLSDRRLNGRSASAVNEYKTKYGHVHIKRDRIKKLLNSSFET